MDVAFRCGPIKKLQHMADPFLKDKQKLLFTLFVVISHYTFLFNCIIGIIYLGVLVYERIS